MARGRPIFSQVRQNMVEILDITKKAYGYELYTIYRSIFPITTLRLIYYHLKKGVSLGEFKVYRVVAEKGDYSWGPEAEKIYYSLGDNAKPAGDPKVHKFFEKHRKSIPS
jgi:hypothetical protein